MIANPVLAAGEFGFETDSFRFKVGDGTTAWVDLGYESAIIPVGTRASPESITAVGGITPEDVLRQMVFVVGSSGAVVITASPQIAAGTVVGQELILCGRHDVNTVSIANGTGLELNGTCVLRAGSRIYLVWDGTVWGEVSRNDV